MNSRDVGIIILTDRTGIKSTGESLKDGSFLHLTKSGSCNVFIQDLENRIQLELNGVLN